MSRRAPAQSVRRSIAGLLNHDCVIAATHNEFIPRPGDRCGLAQNQIKEHSQRRTTLGSFGRFGTKQDSINAEEMHQ